MPKMKNNLEHIPEHLREIYLRYKGKGGDPEAECSITDSKLDKDETFNGKAPEGVVIVSGNKKDIALIIERVGDGIVYVRDTGENGDVMLYIRRKFFRGVNYCFKNNKE